MENKEIEKLKTEFNKKSYRYVQKFASGKKYMYEIWVGERLAGYEVFKIKLLDRVKLLKMLGDDYLDDKKRYAERYPNNESFGKWAWYYMPKQLNEAIDRFNS